LICVLSMIFDKTGHVANELYVAGLPWSPVYLLNGSRPIIFEAGFTCAGRLYENDIRAVLKGRQPEILFLTHVHWDHCGATSYLKELFPHLKVAASERDAMIIRRPNAQKLMAALSREIVPFVSALNNIDTSKLLDRPFGPFHVDMILRGGQIVEIDKDLTVQVLSTPGHTRDHLSYYIPERMLLIATEAAGCLDKAGHILTEFLVDYDEYIGSLERLSTLPVEILCQGHHFVFVGREEVQGFFARSIEQARRFKTSVLELLQHHGGSAESVVQKIKAAEWDRNPGIKQLEKAYLLNLRAQVTSLAAKLAGSSVKSSIPTKKHAAH
jgi:glyoxylase-like metal-dependent hydrolase (beta-lactamase superfamily II)